MPFRGNSSHALLFVIVLGLFAAAPPVSAQAERKVTKLADGVYEIRHRDAQDGFAGGNTTVIIGDKQVFVVDAPSLPSDAREDIAQIRQWTDKPVSFLMTTHFHNDHNLGNRAYMDAFLAVAIIAHVERRRTWTCSGQVHKPARKGAPPPISRCWTAERQATPRR